MAMLPSAAFILLPIVRIPHRPAELRYSSSEKSKTSWLPYCPKAALQRASNSLVASALSLPVIFKTAAPSISLTSICIIISRLDLPPMGKHFFLFLRFYSSSPSPKICLIRSGSGGEVKRLTTGVTTSGTIMEMAPATGMPGLPHFRKSPTEMERPLIIPA